MKGPKLLLPLALLVATALGELGDMPPATDNLEAKEKVLPAKVNKTVAEMEEKPAVTEGKEDKAATDVAKEVNKEEKVQTGQPGPLVQPPQTPLADEKEVRRPTAAGEQKPVAKLEKHVEDKVEGESGERQTLLEAGKLIGEEKEKPAEAERKDDKAAADVAKEEKKEESIQTDEHEPYKPRKREHVEDEVERERQTPEEDKPIGEEKEQPMGEEKDEQMPKKGAPGWGVRTFFQKLTCLMVGWNCPFIEAAEKKDGMSEFDRPFRGILGAIPMGEADEKEARQMMATLEEDNRQVVEEDGTVKATMKVGATVMQTDVDEQGKSHSNTNHFSAEYKQ